MGLRSKYEGADVNSGDNGMALESHRFPVQSPPVVLGQAAHAWYAREGWALQLLFHSFLTPAGAEIKQKDRTWTRGVPIDTAERGSPLHFLVNRVPNVQ